MYRFENIETTIFVWWFFFDYLTTNNEWSGKNSLIQYQNEKYSEEQEQTHNLIKSLHESGLGYRKISQILNKKNIKTSKGNTWKNTQVHSVLKRYRERQERLELMNIVYEPVWGKMYLKTVKRETIYNKI